KTLTIQALLNHKLDILAKSLIFKQHLHGFFMAKTYNGLSIIRQTGPNGPTKNVSKPTKASVK
ncbi:hypothetical protein, partial [Shewanella sp. 10N.286.52.B9]|uniref:hypothetical protein n=1 Tax=Shewanella sp. 10N.286.52.B9 TaxID=1880837 RepID=UPI001A7E1AA9